MKSAAAGAGNSAQRAPERSASGPDEQRLYAQKMEAIGQLAGGVAHEFNNLLLVILNCADWIKDNLRRDDPLRADADEIKQSALRAANLTRQLLMFSGRQISNPRLLDINELVAKTEAVLRRLLDARVELIVLRDPAPAKAIVDAASFDQLIVNLVLNARDAMPEGGRLTISTTNVGLDEAFAVEHHGIRPGPHVRLSISDTGTGMDEATTERIFDPFFTTKDQGKGTGLGLATVYGIVQQSEATIMVTSKVGRGTTFEIYFPAASESVEARALSSARGPRE